MVGDIGEFVPVKLAAAETAAQPSAAADPKSPDDAPLLTPPMAETFAVEFVLAGGRVMRVSSPPSCEQLKALIRAVEGV